MRRWFLLAALALIAADASAARRFTVAQLEETLSTEIATHHADADIARRVGEMELSERLTSHTLDRFAAQLALGPHTALALEMLSDQSAFFDPPVAERPATEPPDEAAQQKMIVAARIYAVQTWARLPNFFVTRTTNRFDDTPQVLKQGDWPVRAGLHPVGSATRNVTFREGKEVSEAEEAAQPGAAQARAQPQTGLSSWGEFGPALAIVLADMVGHKATFSHWELMAAGLAAVYRYEVPRDASHYVVTFNFSNDQEGSTQFGYSGRTRSLSQMTNIPRPDAGRLFHETPAYHGEIAIDPATGAVLRITIEASLSGADPLLRAATMIEYGRVTIGDRQYISPLHSLAISLEPGSASNCANDKSVTANGVGDLSSLESPLQRCAKTPVLLVNETSFSGYHRLGSTMRILADASGTPGDQPAGDKAGAHPDEQSRTGTPPAPNAGLTSDAGADARSASDRALANASAAPPQSAAQSVAGGPLMASAGSSGSAGSAISPVAGPGASSSASPAAASSPLAAAPVDPEVTMSAANGPPDEPATAAGVPDVTPTLKLSSRLVDIGVVVYDKKGHPVTDLRREDFEIYDNGRKQEIRFFSEFSSEAPPRASAGQTPGAPAAPAAGPAAAAGKDETFTNRAPDAVAPGSAAPDQDANATILLIDQSHIAWADLTNARQQVVKFLNEAAPGERIGIYTMTTLGFKVLSEITADHAELSARLEKWMPNAQAVSQAQEEEIRNRQHFDEVHNVADLNSVNGNHIEVPDGAQMVDPQLLTMGDNPERASLIILRAVARHLSAMTGHKSLVWISSDNVFADFQDQAVGIDKSSKYIDSYALGAQEAMNEAHVAVYPFDVSQIEGGAITADLQHRNVELTQAAADSASLAPGGGGANRNMTDGRIIAQTSQDIHPIQEAIQQVAAATGGHAVRRASDLAAQLKSVVGEGHSIYRVSFSPDTAADNKYHSLTVKLAGKRGLTARYRTGYLFAKEPATLKERFQQAVWRPMDANEVAVTAGVGAMSSGADLTINVAATDLGMEQQSGRWTDKLDIFFIQRDDLGIHAQVEGQTLGLRLKPATYQNLLPIGVPFEHMVQLKPGMESLRVLVVDENSGRMGSVTIPAGALEKKQ